MSNVSNYTEYGQLGTMETEKIENLKAAAEGGGGGGGFEVVNISVNAGTFTNDMTYGEMSAALSEGIILVARLVDQYVNGTAFIVSNAGLSTSINCDIGGMKLIMRASSGDDNNVWSFAEG